MMFREFANRRFFLNCLLSTALAVGCGPVQQSAAPTTEEQHNHPSEGPHHGELVELGNEEYHAEVVHSGEEVTIYILDAAAKVEVPVDATEVTINLTHDGQAEQFKLRAVAGAEGKSSQFTLRDAELASDLESTATVAKLVVAIGGKSYSGQIEHHHDEAGDNHEGETHAHDGN